MGKVYPHNVTCNQYELVNELIPEGKPGGSVKLRLFSHKTLNPPYRGVI